VTGCRHCRHFHNAPAELDALVAGLKSLGSAWASVGAEDSLCAVYQRYLPAAASCDRFAPRAEASISCPSSDKF
jgi:hypothetical protein